MLCPNCDSQNTELTGAVDGCGHPRVEFYKCGCGIEFVVVDGEAKRPVVIEKISLEEIKGIKK